MRGRCYHDRPFPTSGFEAGARAGIEAAVEACQEYGREQLKDEAAEKAGFRHRLRYELLRQAGYSAGTVEAARQLVDDIARLSLPECPATPTPGDAALIDAAPDLLAAVRAMDAAWVRWLRDARASNGWAQGVARRPRRHCQSNRHTRAGEGANTMTDDELQKRCADLEKRIGPKAAASVTIWGSGRHNLAVYEDGQLMRGFKYFHAGDGWDAAFAAAEAWYATLVVPPAWWEMPELAA